ncbi:MAG: GtrA family protein [Chloroflexi bacterium]|nr:GtrA family protein [Chloroflexota bacterium]
MGFASVFERVEKWRIVSYIVQRRFTIIKFLVVGGSAVILCLLTLFILVNYLGFDTKLGENVANAISMELSIIYNFFMSRAITWRDRHKESGGSLVVQMLKFHLALGISIVTRLVLFAALQFLGVFYIINAAIGMVLVAAFNFVAYDTMIFRKRE